MDASLCQQLGHATRRALVRGRGLPNRACVFVLSPSARISLLLSYWNAAVAGAALLVGLLMLGIRTKQINAYGKRGRRVVDVSTAVSAAPVTSEIQSLFEDGVPQHRPLVSNTNKRENLVPSRVKPSAVPVGLQKKKRLSAVLSPPKKTRVAQLISSETAKGKAPSKAKPLPTKDDTDSDSDIEVLASPPRKPLSTYTLNIPGSPINPPKRVVAKKPITSKAKKPFAPFVDVDIIVLDDDGKTVSKERRVSRSNVDVNTSAPPAKAKKPMFKARQKVVDTDSEDEIIASPLNRPRRTTSRKAIIISDDSDSASEYEASAPSSAKVTKPTPTETKPVRPKNVVEVFIPPAPYKIPRPAQQTAAVAPPRRVPSPARPASPVAETSQYPSLPSPPLKPRQLTPIRRNRRALFAPPSPPSPTTPSDFDFDDLSLDFGDLSISEALHTQGTYQSDFQVPEYLLPLLEECGQEECGPHNFSSFIESFPCDPILHSARTRNDAELKFKKIGEASYSEVFGIGDVVLKVIPLRDETKTSSTVDEHEEEGPAPSDARDVRKEIIVTRAMGEVYGGFVKLLKTYVVRGRYPEVLLRLWDEYNDRKGSESVRPDTFKVSQVYAIIVLPNGGPDLEAYTFQNPSKTGWRQACSLFWQVAKALSHAEALVSFEHRDLHWGQILVKTTPTQGALKPLNLNNKLPSKSRRVYMDDPSHGVEATVIDLGLSRMDAGDGSGGNEIHWTPFDEEVFMGEGDYQFDVYRIMKDLTGGKWKEFHPVTNVLWLHYLLQKLIHSKGIKPPAAARKMKASSESAAAVPASKDLTYSEKDCYECLLDIENWLGDAIAEVAAAPKAGKNGKAKQQRKGEAVLKRPTFGGPARAGEIVAYGAKKGWIKPTVMT